MSKKSTRQKESKPKHDTLPASVGLVKEVRAELVAKMESVHQKLGAQIQEVLVSVHRSQTLMEEQRGENRIVLDGLKNVTERQDRIEGQIIEIRDTVR